MRIASVLRILFFVSSSKAQIENLLGLNLETVYGNVETIENAFGKTLTKKLMDVVTEAYAGTFTPKRALEFLEGLTIEEKDGAANGIIALVKELERIVSAPGVKEQLRMGFDLAPFMMRQVISSSPEPTKKPAEPVEDKLEDESGPKRADEVVMKLKQNQTEMGETKYADDVDTDDIRGLLGDLMGSGKAPEEFLEVIEHLLDLADVYANVERLEERLAVDDKSTAKLSQIKDKLANIDQLLQEKEEKVKEDSIKEEKDTIEETAKDFEKDEL